MAQPEAPGFPVSLSRLIEEARSLDMQCLDGQVALTRDVVLPAMPRIEALALGVRRLVDAELQARPPVIHSGDHPMGSSDGTAQSYPIGQCAAIRDRGFQRLSLEPEIRALVAQGVVFKRVYIILKGLYFQNALQLGNVYLDIANDTVEASKPCLEWMPISEVEYVNLESLETLATVAEKYHRCRVYPNVFFPVLAPVVPFLAVREEGRLDLLDFTNSVFLKDLGSGLERLLAWLGAEGEFQGRRLPASYVESLTRRLGANDFETFPFEFRPCTLGDVAENAREIVRAARRPDQEALVLTLLKLIPRARRALHRMEIR